MQPTTFRYTNATLYAETMKSWSKIIKEVPKENLQIETPKKEIARAFDAYTKALEGKLPFMILGDTSIRSEDTLLKNFGTLATDPQVNQKEMRVFLQAIENLTEGKKLNEAVTKHVTEGAVLNDSNWWLYRNDLFMLGAIHAGKEFHIAAKNGVEPKDQDLWDKENGRMRVLGRELTMLALAGYTRIQGPNKLGIVFAPPPKEQTIPLTLSQCRAKFAEIKSAADIRPILQVHKNCCGQFPAPKPAALTPPAALSSTPTSINLPSTPIQLSSAPANTSTNKSESSTQKNSTSKNSRFI